MPMPTKNQNERPSHYCQGYQEGQSEAEALLAQAAQVRGVPLTKREISDLCNERLQWWTDRWRDEGWPLIEDWESGWSVGFTWTCIQAERQAPNSDGFRQVALSDHSRGTSLWCEETSDEALFQDVRVICDAALVETLVAEFTHRYASTPGVSVYDWGYSARFGHGYTVLECEGSRISEVLSAVLADPRIRGHLIYDLPDLLITPELFCVQKKGGHPHASK